MAVATPTRQPAERRRKASSASSPTKLFSASRRAPRQQQIDRDRAPLWRDATGCQSFPLIDLTLYRWRIGAAVLGDTIGAVENERLVASAQPNYLFTLQEDAAKASSSAGSDAGSGTSNDAGQYVLGKLQIEQAHQVATGKNISIAVINSEIDAKHPDLAGAIAKASMRSAATKPAIARHCHGRRHRRPRQAFRHRARPASFGGARVRQQRRRRQGNLVCDLQKPAMGGGQRRARDQHEFCRPGRPDICTGC